MGDRAVADSLREFWDEYTYALKSFGEKVATGNFEDIIWGEVGWTLVTFVLLGWAINALWD